jgi:hypothetical protein
MPRTVGCTQSHSLTVLRAVQITRFGGPEVLEIVDIPEPEAGSGQRLYARSSTTSPPPV